MLTTWKSVFWTIPCGLSRGSSSSRLYGAIVELLAKEKDKDTVRILEIGSWAGMSAITWALAAKSYFSNWEVMCIDSWQPSFDLSITNENIYKKMNCASEEGDIFKLFAIIPLTHVYVG